jgi:hypothetical protein
MPKGGPVCQSLHTLLLCLFTAFVVKDSDVKQIGLSFPFRYRMPGLVSLGWARAHLASIERPDGTLREQTANRAWGSWQRAELEMTCDRFPLGPEEPARFSNTT